MTTKEKTAVLQIRLKPELLASFRQYCDTNSINASDLLRKKIEEILKNNPKDA